MEGWTYIKVILPLKLAWEPYYKTAEKNISPGMRVTVLFSGRKYVGVVSEVCSAPDVQEERVHEVECVEHGLDPVGEKEIRLWRFISEYYLCTVGEVYRTAYPNVKTAGEKVMARAEERRALLRSRTLELYEARLGRLRDRLKKKDEEVAGRHSATVTARIVASREKIALEIAELESRIEALGSTAPEMEEDERALASFTGPETEKGTAASIMSAFAEGRNVLLEGGSSSLEPVLTVAGRTLDEGRNVLMLVPDIELTEQLQITLKERFGDRLLIFNSAESAGRRRGIAATLRKNGCPVFILGTRSALFLPFSSLGMVIVEDEHDPFYKQDGAPRYIARDTAVILGGIHGAGVVLKSPTPSLESLYNCISGRYVHIIETKDDGEMEIIDTSVEKRKGGMVGSFSRVLLKAVSDVQRQDGKVMMLRPWGPLDDLKAELFSILPGLDDGKTVEFCTVHEARRRDLEGFSMLAVTGTDLMLDNGDFRADERVMQTLRQFRTRFKGAMLIQTRQGGHPVFSGDSEYPLHLLAERKSFNYPPYSRMVDIVVRDHNEARLTKLSAALSKTLDGFHPAGPFHPVKGRTTDTQTCIVRIMLPKDRTLAAKKEKIAACVGDFEKTHKYVGHIIIDVDPV